MERSRRACGAHGEADKKGVHTFSKIDMFKRNLRCVQ